MGEESIPEVTDKLAVHVDEEKLQDEIVHPKDGRKHKHIVLFIPGNVSSDIQGPPPIAQILYLTFDFGNNSRAALNSTASSYTSSTTRSRPANRQSSEKAWAGLKFTRPVDLIF